MTVPKKKEIRVLLKMGRADAAQTTMKYRSHLPSVKIGITGITRGTPTVNSNPHMFYIWIIFITSSV